MTTMKSSSSKGFLDNFGKLPSFQYEHFVGGVLGGVTSTLVLHPLDLIKIRFAVNDGKSTHLPQYQNIRSAFKIIVKEEGFYGLYKGVNPNIWGAGSSWGLYFLCFNTMKTWFQDGDSNQPLGFTQHMVAAAQSGIFTLMLTNPIWVVKTRLCLQISEQNKTGATRYNGMLDALSKIYKMEGIRGLYKGFVPGLLGVSHGSIQFMVYEELKNKYNTRRGKPIYEKLSVENCIVFAAVSKLIAAAITYPYQVIRARLQDHNHSYKGTRDCIVKILRYEGLSGLYRGMLPCIIHVVPNITIVFLIHEAITSH